MNTASKSNVRKNHPKVAFGSCANFLASFPQKSVEVGSGTGADDGMDIAMGVLSEYADFGMVSSEYAAGSFGVVCWAKSDLGERVFKAMAATIQERSIVF